MSKYDPTQYLDTQTHTVAYGDYHDYSDVTYSDEGCGEHQDYR